METVKKNLLLIPIILSVINVICLASFLIGLSVMNHPISSILTDLGLLCPLIAISSFFYLLIKVKKHSALKYFHFVNAVTFLVPICILTFLILRFLNDWDIYF
ncbi:hypothetical protein AB1L16_13440 [Peribacillus frigoritolerans]|uniref:hypothetical protein n=1 Tax=Peribacillus frigoritolerans TaxID=450367 RepID=UPI0039A245A9